MRWVQFDRTSQDPGKLLDNIVVAINLEFRNPHALKVKYKGPEHKSS